MFSLANCMKELDDWGLGIPEDLNVVIPELIAAGFSDRDFVEATDDAPVLGLRVHKDDTYYDIRVFYGVDVTAHYDPEDERYSVKDWGYQVEITDRDMRLFSVFTALDSDDLHEILRDYYDLSLFGNWYKKRRFIDAQDSEFQKYRDWDWDNPNIIGAYEFDCGGYIIRLNDELWLLLGNTIHSEVYTDETLEQFLYELAANLWNWDGV